MAGVSEAQVATCLYVPALGLQMQVTASAFRVGSGDQTQVFMVVR